MCNKTLNLTRMGESALRSNITSIKHQASIKLNGSATVQATMMLFLQVKSELKAR